MHLKKPTRLVMVQDYMDYFNYYKVKYLVVPGWKSEHAGKIIIILYENDLKRLQPELEELRPIGIELLYLGVPERLPFKKFQKMIDNVRST